MAITNKLITFNKLTSFKTQLAQGNILETSIVFIKDAKKIWTKGTYFDCSGGGSNDEIGYTTDFSVADIEAVYGRGITKPVNVQGLMSAIEANKPIIIPTNITDASQVGGNAVTMAKMENDGFIYLNVIVPYLDGVHKEYFIQIKITTAQLIKSGSNGSITLKELVAKTDLKTINGESILGSGDITISGGGSSSGGAYSEVNHGTSDTTFTLTPNTFHVWDEVESLQLVYRRPTEGIANEYLFQFTSGATATTLYLPDTIKWAGGSAPIIQPNMIYQISILNDLGSVLEFDNAPAIITFYVHLYGSYITFTCSPNMTWSEFVNSEYNTEYFRIDSSNRVTSGAAILIDQTASNIIEDGAYYDTFMDV